MSVGEGRLRETKIAHKVKRDDAKQKANRITLKLIAMCIVRFVCLFVHIG